MQDTLRLQDECKTISILQSDSEKFANWHCMVMMAFIEGHPERRTASQLLHRTRHFYIRYMYYIGMSY